MTDKNTESMGRKTAVRNYIRLLARYERLMEISRTLNSTLNIDTLLEHIVMAATELTDTEAASILLLDPSSGNLRFEASVDPFGISLETVEVPLEGSLAGWIVTHGEVLLIDDVTNEPHHFREVDESSGLVTRNLLGVPLRSHDKIVGALEAVNKHDDEAFTDDDVNTLTTLAAQAAVAIENVRLFEQSDLIAEMVHELRTPLAAIVSTMHLLRRPDLDKDKYAGLLDTVQNETQRLTRMTSDFLDLARLESGRTRLARNPFNFIEVVEWCVKTVSPQADERGVEISTKLPPDGLPELVGDREKIQQVMMNLLTNAIKYNREEGKIEIEMELLGDKVQVAVSDTGLGISEENLPHIFEKFYRVADTEGYTQGTGLGLAIAKSIVDGHGGEMMVESKVDEGTTFRFTLLAPVP